MLGAAIYIVPALVFMCLGSANVQPWNSCKEDEAAATLSNAEMTVVTSAAGVADEVPERVSSDKTIYRN